MGQGDVRRRIAAGESVNCIVKAMNFKSANQLYQMYKRHFGHTVRQTLVGNTARP